MNEFSIDRVIPGLRSKIDGYAAFLPQFIQSSADCEDPSELLGFISGAMRHQERLAEPREGGLGTVSFVAILRDVRVVERSSKAGHVVGKKSELTLEPVSGKGGRGGQKEDEQITTGWLRQASGQEDAFETALSRTLHELARDNLDAEVLVTKWTVENRDGDKFKQLLNLVILKPAEVND